MRSTVVHSLAEIPEGYVRLAKFKREQNLCQDEWNSFVRGRRRGVIGECKLITKWCSKRRNYATFVHEQAALDYISSNRPLLQAVTEGPIAAAVEYINPVSGLESEIEVLRSEVSRLRDVISSIKSAAEDLVAATGLLAERVVA
jgi:hypothetical protein